MVFTGSTLMKPFELLPTNTTLGYSITASALTDFS